MARSTYPAVAASYRLNNQDKVIVYTDPAGTVLANLQDMSNVAIAGSVLTVTPSGLPQFQGPDGVTADLYGRLAGAADTFPIAIAGSTASASDVLSATIQSGDYTFAETDNGTVVESTDASAVTFTIPVHTTTEFPIGAVIDVLQAGAGALTIAAAGGVTLHSAGSKVQISAQWASASLRQRNLDEWVLVGSLA
jgi:hypothetical protein